MLNWNGSARLQKVKMATSIYSYVVFFLMFLKIFFSFTMPVSTADWISIWILLVIRTLLDLHLVLHIWYEFHAKTSFTVVYTLNHHGGKKLMLSPCATFLTWKSCGKPLITFGQAWQIVSLRAISGWENSRSRGLIPHPHILYLNGAPTCLKMGFLAWCLSCTCGRKNPGQTWKGYKEKIVYR